MDLPRAAQNASCSKQGRKEAERPVHRTEECRCRTYARMKIAQAPIKVSVKQSEQDRLEIRARKKKGAAPPEAPRKELPPAQPHQAIEASRADVAAEPRSADACVEFEDASFHYGDSEGVNTEDIAESAEPSGSGSLDEPNATTDSADMNDDSGGAGDADLVMGVAT